MLSEKLKSEINDQVEALLPELVQIRQYLHQHPELGRQEHQTTAFIADRIRKYPVKVVTHPGETGLWVDLVTEPQQPFRAIRCDIDALPIREQNQVAYASQNPGVMHACGHDVHTAILIGTAIVLSRIQAQRPGNLRFLFQPAEELTPGGALDLLKRGVLKDVTSILALHVDPRLPVGKIGIKPGPVMASTDIFKIKLFGRGGHAAAPDTTIDTILVLAQLMNALHHLVSRNISPLKPAVLTITRVMAGTAINIIPGEAEIWGTLRALDITTRHYLRSRLREIVNGVCQTHQATFDLKIDEGAPPVLNNSGLFEIVENACREILSPENVIRTEHPDMGSEDFAWYLEHIPGLMFRLGTHGRPGTDFDLHHPNFDADEAAMAVGVKCFVASCFQF